MNLLRSSVGNTDTCPFRLCNTTALFYSVCGQYCIFYMWLRARGHSMDDIVHVSTFKGKIVIALSRSLLSYFIVSNISLVACIMLNKR